jgi:uncharacterized damage-inducible protein DinB
METVEQYRRWYEYEQDAHEEVMAALETVPASKRTNPEFARAVDLLAHIAAARRLWLFRIGAIPAGPRDLFPKHTALEQVHRDLADIQDAWGMYLEHLDGEELGREFTYRSIEGPAFRNTVEDILTQLFGHSWYHRGQIAACVRAVGGEPALTDFVFWSREPAED